jgi:4-hydroxy-tetrahydrodipicolinate reductase
MPSIRVTHFGLGPIGAAIVKQVAARPGFKIVGAIDIDPAKLGRDLGEVVGVSKKLGVKVSGDAAKALKSSKPDVVVLCTSSSIKKVLPQIEAILKSRTPIVSTTEELSYRATPHAAGAEDSRAGEEGEGGGAWDRRQSGFRDGRAADRADGRVRARRPHHRASRPGRADPPLPFQQKIGTGLTPEQFQKKVDDGSVRHVGLTESIAMIADAMGWTLDRITDDIQPKIASVPVASEFLAVDPGYVCGIVQDGHGYRKAPRSFSCTWKPIWARPSRTMQWRSKARRGSIRRLPAASTATSPRRRSWSTRFPKCSRPRPDCIRCAISRCRRFFPAGSKSEV